MIVINKKIMPADLYEWAIQSLERNEFSQKDEAEILEGLKNTDWIRQKFESTHKDVLIRLYHDLVLSIENEATPVDILSLSRMLYSFSAMRIDTSRLRDLINTSKYVRRKAEAQYLNHQLRDKPNH